MPAFTPNYQIAAGHNNAVGLAAVNTLTDSNGIKLFMPRALPFHQRGERRPKTNAAMSYAGYNTQDWEFRVLLLAQYILLRDTYTGLITVKTDLGSGFANYNATAWIDEKTDSSYAYSLGNTWYPLATGPALTPIRLHLLRLEAL